MCEVGRNKETLDVEVRDGEKRAAQRKRRRDQDAIARSGMNAAEMEPGKTGKSLAQKTNGAKTEMWRDAS